MGGGGVLHWSKTYIYAGGSVLATIAPAGTSEYVEYHHPDRLGTRLISNNQNTQVQEQENLPFGAALSGGSSSIRQFTSYDRSSATGLDYAVKRRYDSLQGRFTQVDPIGMQASSLADPQTLNLYAYCGNVPVNHVDPDGLFFKKLFRAIGKFFAKIYKWVAAIVAIALAVIAIGTGAYPLLIVSGLLLASAFGGKWAQRALAIANTVAGFSGGWGRIGPGGTAGFNPNAGIGISPSISNLERYIYYQNDSSDYCPPSMGCHVTSETTVRDKAPWYRRFGGWIWNEANKAVNDPVWDFIPGAGVVSRGGRGLFSGGRKLFKLFRGSPKRALWQITKEGTDRVVVHSTFGTISRHKSSLLWWSREVAGTRSHGGSVWKVFEEGLRGLTHIADADQYGDIIRGKHKGPTGAFIPWSQLRGR